MSAALRAAAAATLAALLVVCQAQGGWKTGRATYYDDAAWMSIDSGSCMFGYIDKDRFPDYMVGALSDTNPEYPGSCGRCYEVQCSDMDFTDNFGEKLNRNSACYNAGSSVVITITDTCPCYKDNNYHSNKRWCCGDMDHIDLGIWAFEKLADPKLGVIGIKYRSVPCGTQVSNPAQLPAGRSPTRRNGGGAQVTAGGGSSGSSPSNSPSPSPGGSSGSSPSPPNGPSPNSPSPNSPSPYNSQSPYSQSPSNSPSPSYSPSSPSYSSPSPSDNSRPSGMWFGQLGRR